MQPQTVKEVTADPMYQYLREQVDEELVTDVTDLAQQNDKARRMVLQKYGVVPPQLTASEKNLIIREQRLANS